MAKKYTMDSKGAYRTKVWDGTYKNGQKHRIEIRSTKSSADLEKKVAEFREQVESHKATSNNEMDFVEYSWKWFHTCKPNARQNTKSMYENVIEKHFATLKGVPLQKINSYHLLSIISDVSPSLGNKIYLTFKQVIKRAIKDRYLPQIALDDIFEGISSPKPNPKEKRALYDDERQSILNTSLTGQDKTYLWFAYGCGLRREEILALNYEDVGDEVVINKVLTFHDYKSQIEYTTKSRNGVRKVPLPDFLKEYTLEEFNGKTGAIFEKQNGGYHTASSYRNMWNRIVADINNQVGRDTGLTSHYLRHNYCTMLLRQIPVVSIKDVAYLMGDSEQVIIKVYNHLIGNSKERTKAINNALKF